MNVKIEIANAVGCAFGKKSLIDNSPLIVSNSSEYPSKGIRLQIDDKVADVAIVDLERAIDAIKAVAHV